MSSQLKITALMVIVSISVLANLGFVTGYFVTDKRLAVSETHVEMRLLREQLALLAFSEDQVEQFIKIRRSVAVDRRRMQLETYTHARELWNAANDDDAELFAAQLEAFTDESNRHTRETASALALFLQQLPEHQRQPFVDLLTEKQPLHVTLPAM